MTINTTILSEPSRPRRPRHARDRPGVAAAALSEGDRRARHPGGLRRDRDHRRLDRAVLPESHRTKAGCSTSSSPAPVRARTSRPTTTRSRCRRRPRTGSAPPSSRRTCWSQLLVSTQATRRGRIARRRDLHGALDHRRCHGRVPRRRRRRGPVAGRQRLSRHPRPAAAHRARRLRPGRGHEHLPRQPHHRDHRVGVQLARAAGADPLACATAISLRRHGFRARDGSASSSSRSCRTSSRSWPRRFSSRRSTRSAPTSRSRSSASPGRRHRRHPVSGTGATCCARPSRTTRCAAAGGGGGRLPASASPCSAPAWRCSTSASTSSSIPGCGSRGCRARRPQAGHQPPAEARPHARGAPDRGQGRRHQRRDGHAVSVPEREPRSRERRSRRRRGSGARDPRTLRRLRLRR